MEVTIKQATDADIPYWLELRKQLWQPDEVDDFIEEIREILGSARQTAFIVWVDSSPSGFAEISIREYADGCKTSNVGYLEGIYIKPSCRKKGISRLLFKKSQEWFLSKGCCEIASDAEIDNYISIKMHEALGFQSLKPIIQFTRVLKS